MASKAILLDQDVIYHFRDVNSNMVEAWSTVFSQHINIQISQGDIFKDGPAVDAIVSPANSFGFMDGGIDAAYTRHFGIQMQTRLQEKIRTEFEGEIPVGVATVIPCFDETDCDRTSLNHDPQCNGGQPIKFLISAPTMRVPMDVSQTTNAFLAFRAVILAVRHHNKSEGVDPISSVLVPGLCTSVGMMSKLTCAWQMLQAYETYVHGKHDFRVQPETLTHVYIDHQNLLEGEKLAIARHSEKQE